MNPDVLSVVCFKWHDPTSRDDQFVHSTAHHVNVLYNMLTRNLHMPYQFVCVTDDVEGIDPGINTIPLWDKCRNLGGCWNRLYTFSKDMEGILGKRFACIDLDTVICGDVTSIFSKTDPFVGWRAPFGHLSGSFYMMDAGVHDPIWEDFDLEKSPLLPMKEGWTDQGWVNNKLGIYNHGIHSKPCEWSEDIVAVDYKDGVFGYNPNRANLICSVSCCKLPEGARMIFFPGEYDPVQLVDEVSWIKENWK